VLIPVPTEHPFAGIHVRLHRANENILNLENEIIQFFQECKYPVVPEPNDRLWQDAINYHRSLTIPKRFSVLAGEIVHHFRCCLDRIVWVFSHSTYREANKNAVQFPILSEPPDANALKRFERQIGGLANPSKARELISNLQPYKLGADAPDSPVLIIHNMDRFDKHRELVIVEATGNLILPADVSPEIVAAAAAYTDGGSISKEERSALFRALNEQGKVLPQVAFAKLGKRENQFVAPSLKQLAGAMESVIAAFMAAL
jgi:hypothetical protein